MRRSPRSILLVEDDKEVVRHLAERLEREGWRVVIEKDGDWAIRSFERRPCDAVVLDILIPVVSGFQVAERIRALPQGADVPMIMLTGIYRGPRHRSEAIAKYRLLDYLTKPVDVERIIELLRAHFGTGDSGLEASPAPSRLSPSTIDEGQRAEKREVERAARSATAGGRAAGAVDPQLRGNLKRTPFPVLLSRVYRKRRTGGLFLLRDKVKKIVYFRDGHPTYIKSNVLDECLGRVLVRERMITEKECELSVRRMKAEKRQQGAILMELGVISPHNLRYGLERQLQLKLFDVFHWRDGEFVFRDDVPLPEDVIRLDLSCGQIVLEGVRRGYDDARLGEVLAPILHRYVELEEAPELRYQDLDLTAAETLFVDAIDGTRTTSELVGAAPPSLGPRGAMVLLYALHCINVLSTRDAPAEHRRSVSIVGPAPSAPPDDTWVAAFLAERRGREPLAVLGLPPGATAAEVEAAYAALARELHPDRFRGRPETTLALSREAFQLVTQAHATLRGDRAAAGRMGGRHAESVAKPAGAPGAGGVVSAGGVVGAGGAGGVVGAGGGAAQASRAASTVTLARGSNTRLSPEAELAPSTDEELVESPTDPAVAALDADNLFRAGEQRLRAHDFAEAERLFLEAIRLRGDVGMFHAYLGWAVFNARGQGIRAADEALPILERAVELEPSLEQAHLFLGMVYRSMGRADLAEPEFEKALEANPDSAEALRELRQLHAAGPRRRRQN